MTSLLIKLFVRDSDNTAHPRVRARYGSFAGAVGIILNLLLFGAKLLVGLLFSSIAVTADAFNNLSDAGSSIVSLISFRISAKPADRAHPFGHARIEYVASLIVSFLVMLIGIQLFRESVNAIRIPAVAEFDLIVGLVLVGAILAKLWLFIFYRKIARRIDSSVLHASAFDSLSDTITTLTVLISSVLVRLTGFQRLDGITGLAVALFIFIGGIKILRENVNSILGEAPSDALIDHIKTIVSEYPEALGIHDLIVHNYGPGHTMVSLHVEVDCRRDLISLHDVIDQIERQLREQLSVECTIHMDPILIGDPMVDRLREQVTEEAHLLHPSISIHDFRVVHGTTHTNLIFDMAVPFEVKESDAELTEKITDSIHEHLGTTYHAVVTIDRD